MLIVGCWLSVVACCLLVLFVVGRWSLLFVVCSVLCVVCCVLWLVRGLFVVCC